MSTKTETKKSQISKAVIDALIEEHGKEKLKKVLLPKDDLGLEHLEVIVKVPSRNVMSQFMKFIDTNPKKAQELLLNSCLLTSKEEVNADDALFNTCVSSISELIPIRQGVIKNL